VIKLKGNDYYNYCYFSFLPLKLFYLFIIENNILKNETTIFPEKMC